MYCEKISKEDLKDMINAEAFYSLTESELEEAVLNLKKNIADLKGREIRFFGVYDIDWSYSPCYDFSSIENIKEKSGISENEIKKIMNGEAKLILGDITNFSKPIIFYEIINNYLDYDYEIYDIVKISVKIPIGTKKDVEHLNCCRLKELLKGQSVSNSLMSKLEEFFKSENLALPYVFRSVSYERLIELIDEPFTGTHYTGEECRLKSIVTENGTFDKGDLKDENFNFGEILGIANDIAMVKTYRDEFYTDESCGVHEIGRIYYYKAENNILYYI